MCSGKTNLVGFYLPHRATTVFMNGDTAVLQIKNTRRE